MKKNKILIIGNGRSVLKYKLKKQIDSFPIVARINNYKIKNYSKYIGTKTDIWINGGNQNLKIPNSPPNKTLVFIPSDIQKNKTKKNIINKCKRKFYPYNFNIIETDLIKIIEEKVKSKRLTTGLYSIIWATMNFDEVYVHGFDFFIKSKSHYFNYYIFEYINKFLGKGKKHNLKKEQQFYNFLITKNLIKELHAK